MQLKTKLKIPPSFNHSEKWTKVIYNSNRIMCCCTRVQKVFCFILNLVFFQRYPFTPFYDPNLTIITSWTKLNWVNKLSNKRSSLSLALFIHTLLVPFKIDFPNTVIPRLPFQWLLFSSSDTSTLIIVMQLNQRSRETALRLTLEVLEPIHKEIFRNDCTVFKGKNYIVAERDLWVVDTVGRCNSIHILTKAFC